MKTIRVITTKNKKAEWYFRRVMKKEVDTFLAALIREIGRIYSPLTLAVKKADGVSGVHNAKRRGMSPFEIEKLLNRYKKALKDRFRGRATFIVEKWLAMAFKQVRRSFKAKSKADSDFKDAFSFKYSRHKYEDMIEIMIKANVDLITNATAQTISNIENIVYSAMTTGQGMKGIHDGLSYQTEIVERRIDFIARDQTAKANAVLNQLSQQDAGVEYFMWDTSHDERVSEGKGGHRQLQGKIYKWGDTENYPEIDAKGTRGVPSQRPNCRCSALAVILESGETLVPQLDGSYRLAKTKRK